MFYLKNYGTPLLGLKVAVSSVPTNTNNVDLSKVFLVLTRIDTNSTQSLALDKLVSSNAAGGLAMTDTLAGGVVAQYKAQIQMSTDAFSGTNADIGGIDLVFSGVAVTQ
jgi:hypothetical protein